MLIVSETTPAQYLYVVDVSYSFSNNVIGNCQNSLRTKLMEIVPTQTINTCVFSGGSENIKFSVTGVTYSDVELRKVSLYVCGYVSVYVCQCHLFIVYHFISKHLLFYVLLWQ